MEDEVIKLTTCAMDDKYKHIVERPVLLSCGHTICENCYKEMGVNRIIACKICNSLNDRDLSQNVNVPSVRYIIRMNIEKLFSDLYEKYLDNFKLFNNLMLSIDDKIKNEVIFIKDEIQIRIDSIKIELDRLNEQFQNELDEMVLICQKYNAEHAEKYTNFDIKEHESTLNLMKNDIENKLNKQLTDVSLYNYQKKMIDLKKLIEEFNELRPKIDFRVSESIISKATIGNIDLTLGKPDSRTHERLIKSVKTGNYSTHEINATYTYEICQLPSGQILNGNFATVQMDFYDKNYKFMQSSRLFDGVTSGPICVDHDGKKYIFMSDYNDHKILRCDMDYKNVITFGGGRGGGPNQLHNPFGIAYSRGSVYVCDFSNRRIQKFDENLVLQKSYPLAIQPRYIKVSSHAACVKSNSNVGLCFYDINTFVLQYRFEGHDGILGCISNYFYEFDGSTRRLYCYNKYGRLFEQVMTDDYNSLANDNDGCIAYINNKMTFLCYGTKTVVTID